MTEKPNNIPYGHVRFIVDIPISTKKKTKMYATFTGKTIREITYEALEEYIAKMSQDNRQELRKVGK